MTFEGQFCFPKTTASSLWVVARPGNVGMFNKDMTIYLRPAMPSYVAYPAVGYRNLSSLRYFLRHDCDDTLDIVAVCRSSAFSEFPTDGACTVPPTSACHWEVIRSIYSAQYLLSSGNPR